MRILALPSDCAECFAQTSPTCSPRFQLADVLPAKAASCRSWFAFAQGITVRYAVGRLGTRSHAFFLHETRAYAYLQPGAIRCCLSYGKQCASLRRPNKGVEKACVYAMSEACGPGTAYEVCLRNPRIVSQS